MLRKYAGEPENWTVERGDVLDDAFINSLGQWNFVYSWGVLHHTGDVWRALANAQRTVAENGIFYIALYSADVQTDPEFWLKPEMHTSVVEIGTGVCRNIKEAKAEIIDIRRHIVRLARQNGLRLAAGGTHPFAQWRDQEIYPDDRYRVIVEDLKMVARANLIFGLHIHVGVEDRETAIQLMNGARYFLPTPCAPPARRFGSGWRPVCAPTAARSSTIPPHQHPGHVPELVGIRELREPPDPHQLHR